MRQRFGRRRLGRREKTRSEQIGGGLVLVAIGLGAWAVQSGRMEAQEVLSYWPVLVIIHGVEKLFAGKIAWGFSTLALGGVLFVEPWRDFMLHDGWPLLLILAGLGITLGALKTRRGEISGDEALGERALRDDSLRDGVLRDGVLRDRGAVTGDGQ